MKVSFLSVIACCGIFMASCGNMDEYRNINAPALGLYKRYIEGIDSSEIHILTDSTYRYINYIAKEDIVGMYSFNKLNHDKGYTSIRITFYGLSHPLGINIFDQSCTDSLHPCDYFYFIYNDQYMIMVDQEDSGTNFIMKRN